MEPKDISLESSEQEILTFCQKHAGGSPGLGVGHEMRLNYGLNLLMAKQQEKLLNEQRAYNDKQLFWSRTLSIATMVLAGATILLVKFG